MPDLTQKMFDLVTSLDTHLEQIQRLFKPGAKVTLIVRNPMVDDLDVDVDDVVTGDDTAEDVIATINRMKDRTPLVETGDIVFKNGGTATNHVPAAASDEWYRTRFNRLKVGS